MLIKDTKTMENNTLLNAVNVFKNTDFYKNIVETLYVCEEEPDVLFFKPKAPYTRHDIRNVFIELEKHETGYYVQDVSCACRDMDEQTVFYRLKEV